MVSRLKPDLPLLTAAITRRRVWHANRGSRGPFLLYVLVVATVSAAALLTWLFPALLGPLPGLLFLAAIMVCAWVGGLGPGLAATVISALAVEVLFMATLQVHEPGYQHVIRTALFVLVGVLITLLNAVGRLAEDAIVRSEEFLQSTLDSLSAPIAIIDREGVIVAENAAWHRFFRPRDVEGLGAVGTTYLDVWMAEGGAERAAIAQGMGEVFGTARREFFGEFAQSRGGDRRWFAVRITRFEGRGGVRAVVVHEDITERKRVEEAERRAETLRSVARLASAAAHEINNPLAIIMGNVEIIAEQIDPAVSDRIRPTLDAIERIRRIVQGMTGITNLEFSQQSPSLPEMLDLHRSSATAKTPHPDW
jgi:PAS domain S-box-containing protein